MHRPSLLHPTNFHGNCSETAKQTQHWRKGALFRSGGKRFTFDATHNNNRNTNPPRLSSINTNYSTCGLKRPAHQPARHEERLHTAIPPRDDRPRLRLPQPLRQPPLTTSACPKPYQTRTSSSSSRSRPFMPNQLPNHKKCSPWPNPSTFCRN